MFCKIRAAAINPEMRPSLRPSSPVVLALACAALSLAAPATVHATKADRNEPMSIDADSTKGSVVDLQKHSAVFIGNVVIKQGSLVIHADRLEVKEDPDGRKVGIATGNLANFRQKSDRPDEYTEGEATRIEYDSEANRVRFIGSAHLRVLRNNEVTDEGRAAVISYDTQAETIMFDGKPSGVPGVPAGAEGSGRTHVVFAPRQLRGAAGASAPATAASATGEPR